MNPRWYRLLAALAIVILAAAGCAPVEKGASGTPVPAGGGPSRTPADPGASGGPASGGPGAGGGGGASAGGGSVVAGPAPLSSLTCGTPATSTAGPLPDRNWTEVAWCPVVPIRTGTDHVAPPGAPSPPTITHGDLGPLVAALRAPDAPRSTAPCPLYRVLLPAFWLVDGDDMAFGPRLPVGPCGQPSQAVTDAMRALGMH